MSSVGIKDIINQKSVFVFDFDGVLVDSVQIKAEAFAELYSPYGSDITDQVVTHHLANGGMSRYEKLNFYHTVLLGMRKGEFNLDKLINQFSEIVVDKVIACPEIPGAEKFIKEKYSQHKLYINSATPQDEIRQIILARGLNGYFDSVLGSPATKSENLAHIRLLNRGLPHSQFLFFGDALSDLEAAHKNDFQFIGVAGGRGATKSILHGRVENDMIIDDFTCILENS